MKYYFPIIVTALCILSGCATKPPPSQVERLPIIVPENWTSQGDLQESLDLTNAWIDDFSDATLKGLIEEAQSHNYNLAAAQARLEAARAAARISGADRWPAISLETGGSRTQRSNTSGFVTSGNRTDTFTLDANFSWELDIWGRIKNAHEAGIADWQASQEDFRATQLSLAANTARAWFIAIEANMELALAEQTLASFEANVNTIEQQYQQGIAQALDLRLLRANALSAKSTVERRLRIRDDSVRSLEILLGRYPARELAITDTLPQLTGSVPAGLPSELLLRRPDIAAAERRLAASQRRSKEAFKARLPSIRLTASGGTSTNEFKDLLDTDFKVWSLAYGISQPIFDGKRLKSRELQAQAVEAEALANYANTVLTAFQEVESALFAQNVFVREVRALSDAVVEYKAAEALAWEQYTRGLVDIVTVLESQRRYFNAQSSYLQAVNQQLQSRINLYLSLGGSFLEEQPKDEQQSVGE